MPLISLFRSTARTVQRIQDRTVQRIQDRGSSGIGVLVNNNGLLVPIVTEAKTKLCWTHQALSRTTVRTFFRKSEDDSLATTSSSNSTASTHFSTQAEMLQHLGISSNGQIRPSTREQRTNEQVNQRRRRRQKFPPRRSDDRPGALYPLKAMHIAQTIDLDKVMQTVLHNNTEKRKLFGKNSLVVELETPADEPDTSPPRFVSVFRFGSVVFLNIPDKDAVIFLEQIRKLSTDRVDVGSERREHFGIMVQPEESVDLPPEDATMTSPPPDQIVTGDYCVVQEIDLNGVAVISNILAQTVALDSYNDTVDRLLSQFAAINSAVRGSGQFRKSDKNFLFKTVAVNNAIFIDMISKIRLKDRSDTAWTMTKYETLHYGLKAEFEIDDRFDQIEFKLNLIQQNAKFFLEVLQSQKSNSLEWIIVWLIALESALMCIDMSGKGEDFFRFMGLL